MKPSKVAPVSAQRGNKHIRFGVYGAPGVGKTRLCGTASSALFLRPPMDHTVSAAIAGSTADEWVIESWNEAWDALEYLQHEGHSEYEWSFVDSVSLWQDVGLDDVYEGALARKATPEARAARAQYGPDKGEYGVNMFRLAKFMRHFTALPMNVGFTAHPFFQENQITGEGIWLPWIQGKEMAEKICGYMNIIGNYKAVQHKGKLYRVLYVEQRGEYYAKDQYDAFKGGKIINPTIPKMTEAIQARLNGKRR